MPALLTLSKTVLALFPSSPLPAHYFFSLLQALPSQQNKQTKYNTQKSICKASFSPPHSLRLPPLAKSNVGNLLATAVAIVVVLLTRNRNRRCAAPTWQNLRQLFGRLENVHRAYKLAKLEARKTAAASSCSPSFYDNQTAPASLHPSVSFSGKCQSFGIKKCFQIKLIYII